MVSICFTCPHPPSFTSFPLLLSFIPFQLASSNLQYIFSFFFACLTHFLSISPSSLFSPVFQPVSLHLSNPFSLLPPSLSRLWAILNNCSVALSFARCLSRFGCYLHTQHALTTPKTICNHTWRHVHPPTQSTVKINGVCLAQQDQSHTESHLWCTNQWPRRCVWASLFTSFSFPLIHPTVYRSLFPQTDERVTSDSFSPFPPFSWLSLSAVSFQPL